MTVRRLAGSILRACQRQCRTLQERYYRRFYSAPRVFLVNVPAVGKYRMRLRLADSPNKVKRAKGRWEKEVKAVFHQLIAPGDVVLDIGAHLGDFTMEAAILCGGAGHVHAVELIPSFFAALNENLSLNRFDNVTTHLLGLADVEGTIQVADGYGYLASPVVGGRNVMPATAAVSTTTLDRLCLRLERVDVIKMDVEGAERKVLEGGKETFSRPPGISLVCEIHPTLLPGGAEDVARIYEFLKDRSYRIYLIPENSRDNPHIFATRRQAAPTQNLIPTEDPWDLIAGIGY
jgi:FkbM family methyltransferase